jgi:predicted membrane protein
MSTKNQSRTLAIALLIIAAGVLLLVNSLNLIPYEIRRIVISWQMLLIAIGFISLLTSKEKITGLVLIAIGGIFLIAKMTSLPVSVWSILWPTVLIIIGVSLLYSHSRKGSFQMVNEGEDSAEYIDEVAIFGGNEKSITARNFRGGKITNIFGGSELNFSKAELAEGESQIEVLYIFGGSSIIVPPDWDVNMDVVSVFGGFSDKRYKKHDAATDVRKRLTIKGLVIFGGGDLKSY